jgi:uncharacterized phage infection (PIP) family protein YhgE
MSWEHRGRTYGAAEYHRNRSHSEVEELRNANSALRNQSEKIRNELNDARSKLTRTQNDLQERARLQERLEQKQREYESIQNQIQQRQQQFEAQVRQRDQEIEQEIRLAERHAEDKIQELKAETSHHISTMHEEIDHTVEQMNQGLDNIRSEVNQARNDLEHNIGVVRNELEAERRHRIEKEKSRSAQAAHTIEWVENRSTSLHDMDTLGLTIEKLRMQESLNRARELLKGGEGDLALSQAEVAAGTYQTSFLEAERRIGVINGAAEHVHELAQIMATIASQETLREVFPIEAVQIDYAVTALKARADNWRSRRQWIVFENERHKVIEAANQFLAQVIELEASVPRLVRQLEEREQNLEQVGDIIRTVAGAADSVELTYANSEDVKSPRLARTYVGKACIDVYLELDGTYRVDAYGFDSPLQCSESASRMKNKLAEGWTVSEEVIDPTNRQQPNIKAIPAAESWRKISSDLHHMNKTIATFDR